MKQTIKTKLRNSKGFTLVEMLVVIAIIAIILGMGAAGVKALAEGNPTIEATSLLKNSVKEARKLAEGRGENVRLVIHADDSDTSDLGMRRYLKYVALAMKNSSGDWEVINKGVLLPKNAFFDQTRSLTDSPAHSDGTDGVVSVKIGGENIDCYYYEFSSDGLMYDPPHELDTATTAAAERGVGSSAPRVVVNEGLIRRSGGSIKFVPAETSKGERAYRGFVIFRSGRTSEILDKDEL